MPDPILYPGYLTTSLAEMDPEIAASIAAERARQQGVINLIASENIVSRAVLEAQGSVLTNKSVEGYPGRRYHRGAIHADAVERLAIERACRLFGCRFANVQPHSGSQANHATMYAVAGPGGRVLAMDLSAGGHLSHGSQYNLSSGWFDVARYGVRTTDGLIDYDAVEEIAQRHHPKLIIAGGSAYARAIEFARFRRIADKAGALLLADIAHFAGLVAGGVHPSPFPHAHVVTTTTYKSLRGPRGAIILCNDQDLSRRVNRSVFPGLQGTPMMHVVAAKAVCFAEALRPQFRRHAMAVLTNARALADVMQARGFPLVGGGTDTPMVVVNLRPSGVNGVAAADSLERAGIACNANPVPSDTDPEAMSGLRFGTSACTTRGLGVEEFRHVGELTVRILAGLQNRPGDIAGLEAEVASAARALARRYPI